MIGRMAMLGFGALMLVAAAPDPHPVGPDDIAQIKGVRDPQVDPAGLWVAYAVQSTDIAAGES